MEWAELLINLPRDWKLTKADCREERWSWPIQMMLATAHFAMEDPEVGLESRTTLMEGEDGIPFAENTDLRGEILLYPGVFGEESFFCRLPDGDEVNFYQVIPQDKRMSK
ncbi:suppressor of fused domain protein [Flintibacter sp.]|uniref:suppressor of fused domain protein n=1 Tax=Flintibacter sp. TaxID=1918624 RepID=UPI003A4281B6